MKSALRKHKSLHIHRNLTDKIYYAIIKSKDSGAEKIIDVEANYRNQAENYFIEYCIRNGYNIDFIGVYKN